MNVRESYSCALEQGSLIGVRHAAEQDYHVNWICWHHFKCSFFESEKGVQLLEGASIMRCEIFARAFFHPSIELRIRCRLHGQAVVVAKCVLFNHRSFIEYFLSARGLTKYFKTKLRFIAQRHAFLVSLTMTIFIVQYEKKSPPSKTSDDLYEEPGQKIPLHRPIAQLVTQFAVELLHSCGAT